MRKITVLLAFLFLAGMQFAYAQTRTISGKVTSTEDGKGIPGVTIQVKGTAVGTVTDIDGNYSLEIKPSFNTLVFQYVGMKTQELAIGDQNQINLAMEPDVLQMEEVVVTAIGIPRDQKALGYTVQDVANEEIAKSGNTNAVAALEGRVAGVVVTGSSGAAGGAQYITIRGATSIIGDNQPLFVVDGVLIDNQTTRDIDGFQNDDVAGVARTNRALDINPEDIEDISVLKGGAATALYGIRGANGVIVITTKKGSATKGKKVNVNFASSVMFSQINKRQELNDVYGQGSGGEWVSGNASSWGPKMSDWGWVKDQEWENSPFNGFDVDGDMVSKDSDRWNNAGTRSDVSPYDHYDFFRTGVTFNNSLSLSGGNDRANFIISYGNLHDEGIIPNNKVIRNNFRASGAANLSDRWKISGNIQYILTDGWRIQQGSNTSGVMLGLLRTPPSFDNAAGWKFEDGTQRNYRSGGGYDNPYWTANENLWRDRVNRLIGNVAIEWFATDFLRFTYRPGIDWYSEQVEDYIAIGSRTQPTGQVFARNNVVRDFNQDLLAYFNWDFNERFGIYATAGWNLQERSWNYVFGQATGLSIPGYYNLNNSPNNITGEIASKRRLMGYFYDIGFNFKSMLFFNTTGRLDQSTTLPEDNNTFFYPSVNLSFVLTELPGLRDRKAIPYWKIFGSYAQTARDADPYFTATYYALTQVTDGWVQPNGVQFPISTNGNTFNGFTLSNTLGNNQLEPERQTSWEIGTSVKFINNRLGLDVTYFDNFNDKLLIPVDIDPASGYSFAYLNAAEMRSYGWEVVLYATPVKAKNFTWDIQLNFFTFRNPVTQLYESVEAVFLGGFTDPQVRAVVDEQYRTIYGFDWLRDENGNVLIDDDPNSASYGFPTGDYNFSVLGQVNPDWTLGINNTFSFFNFNVFTLLDIRQGGSMWNGTRGALYFFGAHADTEWREDDYIFEGVKSDGSPNDIVVQRDQGWHQGGEGSGFTGPTVDYIEDASWVRLREVTISYSFNDLLKESFVDNLELFFTGRNLFLSTPYTGIDPNTSLLGASNAQGLEYFNMPGTRTYLIGLRFAF